MYQGPPAMSRSQERIRSAGCLTFHCLGVFFIVLFFTFYRYLPDIIASDFFGLVIAIAIYGFLARRVVTRVRSGDERGLGLIAAASLAASAGLGVLLLAGGFTIAALLFFALIGAMLSAFIGFGMMRAAKGN